VGYLHITYGENYVSNSILQTNSICFAKENSTHNQTERNLQKHIVEYCVLQI